DPHPATPAIPSLPPPQLAVDLLGQDRHARRYTLDEGDQPGPMRLARRRESEHVRLKCVRWTVRCQLPVASCHVVRCHVLSRRSSVAAVSHRRCLVARRPELATGNWYLVTVTGTP